MITIKDVAKRAGVSFTTVSHVVNKTRPVAVATAERVEQAIVELGYVPSDVARSLKSQRTRTLGMIVTSTTNPFFAEVIRGVERAAAEAGYCVILSNTDDVSQRLNGYLQMMFTKRIDGLIVMTSNASQDFMRRLAQIKRVPVIAIDASVGTGQAVVNDDSHMGGGLVADFIAERGFQRIAVLRGPDGHPRMADRLQGFLAGLARHNLAVEPGMSLAASLDFIGGRTAADGLLRLPVEERPDVIFAFNDLIAIGAMHSAHDLGLAVPRDVSIIGYDDIEFAAHIIPPLTTVHQPALEIGLKASEIMIEHLIHGLPMPQLVALPPSLVIRESVRGRA